MKLQTILIASLFVLSTSTAFISALPMDDLPPSYVESELTKKNTETSVLPRPLTDYASCSSSSCSTPAPAPHVLVQVCKPVRYLPISDKLDEIWYRRMEGDRVVDSDVHYLLFKSQSGQLFEHEFDKYHFRLNSISSRDEMGQRVYFTNDYEPLIDEFSFQHRQTPDGVVENAKAHGLMDIMQESGAATCKFQVETRTVPRTRRQRSLAQQREDEEDLNDCLQVVQCLCCVCCCILSIVGAVEDPDYYERHHVHYHNRRY